jgi:hypothetical protein
MELARPVQSTGTEIFSLDCDVELFENTIEGLIPLALGFHVEWQLFEVGERSGTVALRVVEMGGGGRGAFGARVDGRGGGSGYGLVWRRGVEEVRGVRSGAEGGRLVAWGVILVHDGELATWPSAKVGRVTSATARIAGAMVGRFSNWASRI